MSVKQHKKTPRKNKHQDHRLVGILRKTLRGVRLKEKEDFRIDPKIGGPPEHNKIVIYITAKHRDEHRVKLERAAQSEGIKLEFKELKAA